MKRLIKKILAIAAIKTENSDEEALSGNNDYSWRYHHIPTSFISRLVCSWSFSNSGLQSNVRIGTSFKRLGTLRMC